MGNTPNVRFKGFTEDWEQRKVLDLLELLTDYDANGSFADMAKNVNTTDGDGYAWYVRITDLENPKPSSELKYVDESSYKFLKKTELHGGELLMAKRGDIGKVYIFEPRTKYATVAPNMYLLKLNDKVIPHFLYDYFVSEEGNKKLTRLNASSTMGALYKDDVKNIDVVIPSIKEQAMLGNFFQSIDHLITLHQQKCDETKEFKKYMLQNMFPQKDEKVPKIRFDGFTGDWEQRKLKEVLSFLKDGTHGTHADTVEGPLLLSAKNIKDGTIRWDESDRRISQDEYEKIHSKFSLKEGDVLLTIVGSIGETAILKDFEGITFQRSVAFLRPNEDISSDFLYAEIQTPAFQKDLESRKSTSAQPGIYLGDLAEISVKYAPSLEEQIKIGEYFEQLDNIITLHQQKCNALKEFKKYMLQNMFPQKGENKCQN